MAIEYVREVQARLKTDPYACVCRHVRAFFAGVVRRALVVAAGDSVMCV